MTEVLLLASKRRHGPFLSDVTSQFRELGARVRFVSLSRVNSYEGLGVESAHSLAEAAEGHPPEFWRKTALAAPGQRMWLHVERDEWTLRHAADAELLVAADPAAIYSVWKLAQIHPDAIARAGVYAGLRALTEHLSAGGAGSPVQPSTPAAPLEEGVRAGPRERLGAWASRFVGKRVHRGEQAHLADPVPAATRVELAVAQAVELIDDGHAEDAVELQETVAGSIRKPRLRADLYGSVAGRELAAGRIPKLLRESVAEELGYADNLLSRGRVLAAAGSFLQATRLAFYPGVHFDALMSPLAEDPEAFTAPLRSSQVLQRLAAPQGRLEPAAAPPAGRPPRVLLVSSGNINFVGDLAARLELDPGAELRFLTPREMGAGAHYVTGDFRRMLSSLLNGDGRVRQAAEEELRPHLDWADVVLVEWCTRMAHFLTLVDPGSARVVLRLHSFEAWTLWPHLVDYTRVDRVLFVSEHLRELTEAAVPALAADGSTEVTVVPNVVDLTRFDLPKQGDVRFDVALVGFAAVAKDVRWAMQVIRQLREHDPRYRLLLFGDDLPDSGTGIYRRYLEGYRSDLAELEPEGAVVRMGRTSDVAGALTGVGVVLSSSLRESAHLAIVEGAASGAVPVVRDWPFFANQKAGARTLYPSEWVVDSVEAAAARVLMVTRTQEEWRREAERARLAAKEWDAEATIPAFRRALFD